MEERCLICGAIIPEGRQICPICERNGIDKAMDDEHIIQECICLQCYYRWIDVRPVGAKLKDIECPGCGKIWYVIGTGEPLNDLQEGM